MFLRRPPSLSSLFPPPASLFFFVPLLFAFLLLFPFWLSPAVKIDTCVRTNKQTNKQAHTHKHNNKPSTHSKQTHSNTHTHPHTETRTHTHTHTHRRFLCIPVLTLPSSHPWFRRSCSSLKQIDSPDKGRTIRPREKIAPCAHGAQTRTHTHTHTQFLILICPHLFICPLFNLWPWVCGGEYHLLSCILEDSVIQRQAGMAIPARPRSALMAHLTVRSGIDSSGLFFLLLP